MARWESGTKQRLSDAAFDLFAEQGFDQVTAKAIAARAGLTERTFFRHFADKRDVLFLDGDLLDAQLTEPIARGEADADAPQLVFAALAALADRIGAEGGRARLREGLVAGSAELRERERTKYAHIEAVIAGALVRRGIPDRTAALAAAVGLTALVHARDRWLAEGSRPSLRHHLTEVFVELESFVRP